jgi:4-hydroxybenzoate polyprenyltransferase
MKLATALKLGRVSNLPTVWSNVLAGLVLAGGELDPSVLVRLGCMATFLYVAGMFLNDAFDAEIDARERPERPIPSGEVKRSSVFAWAALMSAGGIAIAATLGPWPLAGALGTLALILVYDRFHKGNPIAPLLMGMCRVGLYLTAALCVSPNLPAPVAIGGVVLLLYVLGLTYAAAHENSNALVRFGPLAGLWGPALLCHGLVFGPSLGRLLLLGFAVWTLRALRLVRARTPTSIRGGIVSLIAGISLVDGLLIAHAGQVELVPLAVGAFLATLGFQRFVSGT